MSNSTSSTDAQPLDLSSDRARFKADPEEALAIEFSRHRHRLCQMIKFRLDPVLATRVDVDDVLQEAWLAARKRVDHFLAQTQWSPFVWLRMIISQTLVDLQRHHLGTKMRDAYREWSPANDPLAQSTSMSIANHLLAKQTSPSRQLMRAEDAAELQRAIDGMDPIDREVLALRHFEELTNNEVAEVLGIQIKAASIRYVRAIRRLKQILQQNTDFRE